MCLIVLAWHAHPDYPLIVAANRDEFFGRPTDPAHWWGDAPDLLAGRDRLRGGTWLGITRQGRVAMVTNYREPPSGPRAPESRGALVGDYLKGDLSAAEYLQEVAGRRADYDGFNLIAGDRRALWFLGKRESSPRELAPGIHAMSNGDLDAPWPKVRRGKSAMAQWSGAVRSSRTPGEGSEALTGGLFSMLADRAPAPDAELPDTGVGRELERKLSPVFVHMDGYGTRSSTVLLVDAAGGAYFRERTYSAVGAPVGDAVHEFSTAN